MTTKTLIYKITSQIPQGKVLTYQKLAKMAEIKSPRVVGNILHQNKDPKNIPCHRVVRSDGGLAKNYAFGGMVAQENKLREEGIELENGKVNLKKRLWVPNK